MQKTHILVISDIHLESGECRAEALLNFLSNYEFEKLIIAGDLYEKGNGIGDKQFEVVSYLRKHREKVVYVDGNHDSFAKKLVSRVIGVASVKKYEWKAGKKKFCVMHGHQFDRHLFLFRESVIDKFFSFAIWFLKKIDKRKRNLFVWINFWHEKFSLHIAKKAKRYAKKRSIDVIICGHTHVCQRLKVFNKKTERTTEYLNSGCWVQRFCSFITISKEGEVNLCQLDSDKSK